MSDQPALNLKHFDSLMDSVLEASATAEQVELFNACLRQDPAARFRYIAYIDLHAALADPAGPLKDPAPADLPDIMSEVIDQALALRRQHEIEDEANKQLASQQAEDARNRRFELRRQAEPEPEPVKRVIVIPQALVWLSVAAVLGLAAAVFYQVNPPKPATQPPGPVVVESPPEPVVSGPAAPVYVARVTGSADALWEGLDPADPRFEPGKRVVLREGIAEITFDDGAAVLVEAPATFEPTGPNAMRLVRGRLSAKVPDSAYGFEVVTPQMVVTDLGTEFGVHASRRRGTLTDVFTGQVVVNAPASDDRLELTTGAAARATAAQPLPEPVAADPARFYRSIATFAAAPQITGRGRWLRSAPVDLSFQAYESDQLSVVPERGGVAWDAGLPIDEAFGPGPITGQRVDVYLVHYDAVGSNPTPLDGSGDRELVLTFDRPVLGVVTQTDSLFATDAALGTPGTAYPSPHGPFAIGRGLETLADFYELSDDGRTLRVRMRGGPQIDQMRVIVASPT